MTNSPRGEIPWGYSYAMQPKYNQTAASLPLHYPLRARYLYIPLFTQSSLSILIYFSS